uniref:Uncharacterized protein n=1 Tax=Rhizophora mucronata TaxID=61149 RepID=A0A2P2M3V4_RHIMU
MNTLLMCNLRLYLGILRASSNVCASDLIILCYLKTLL